jgi:acetyl esterase/lipase
VGAPRAGRIWHRRAPAGRHRTHQRDARGRAHRASQPQRHEAAAGVSAAALRRYSAGTAADHAALAAQLALAADATGYVPEYRRAPEYPFPAAVDDAIDAYRGADVYLNGADPRSPLASPVFGDFTDFPPLLVHVGTDEVLLGDAIALARQASLAGSDVTLRVWAKMIHIFPWFHSHLQAGRTAIEEAGIWIAEVMARQ